MAVCSPFLDLPPELRNYIYEYAAIDEHPYQLKPRVRGKHGRYVLTDCALILANKQISTEYYDVLRSLALVTSSKIVLPVTDFNCRAVINFLTTELSKERLSSICANKRLIIELTITSMGNIHPDRLAEWLRFCTRENVSAGYAISTANSGSHYPERGEIFAVTGLGYEDRETRKIEAALWDLQKFGHSEAARKYYVDAVLMPRFG